MSIITKINEFVASKPSPARPDPNVEPAPSKPETPNPRPQKPSPIPTKKPSIVPVPKMKAEDVVNALMQTLKKANTQIRVDFSKLKEKYA